MAACLPSPLSQALAARTSPPSLPPPYWIRDVATSLHLASPCSLRSILFGDLGHGGFA